MRIHVNCFRRFFKLVNDILFDNIHIYGSTVFLIQAIAKKNFFIWIINAECKHRTCALRHFIICKFVLTLKSGFTAGTIDIGAKLNIFVNTAYNKNDKNWFYQIIKWSIYHFYCYELVCNEYNAIPLWIDSFPHIMKKTLDFCRISSGSCSITYPQ